MSYEYVLSHKKYIADIFEGTLPCCRAGDDNRYPVK